MASLVAVALTTLATACDDTSSLGPDDQPVGLEAAPAAAAAIGPDLGTCTNLAPDAGSKLAFHAYAVGAQIYQWNGTSWAFLGPSATLYASASGRGVVGTHYAGPTWESNSGGTVVATGNDRCPRGDADIPWLLLDAVSHSGPGIFHDVSQIQRVNTVGGQAPAAPGTAGEVRNVPYTAEYYFWTR
jgi:hypothetical protein